MNQLRIISKHYASKTDYLEEDDFYQECLIRIFAKKDVIKIKSNKRAYIAMLCNNTCKNLLRDNHLDMVCKHPLSLEKTYRKTAKYDQEMLEWTMLKELI
jgi:DNA-directed RNA polymerase specialized sigma24 family protein